MKIAESREPSRFGVGVLFCMGILRVLPAVAEMLFSVACGMVASVLPLMYQSEGV